MIVKINICDEGNCEEKSTHIVQDYDYVGQYCEEHAKIVDQKLFGYYTEVEGGD